MMTTALYAEDGPCHVQCKQNMPITLGYNCQYTLQANDILDYPPPSCTYIINVYNAQNQPIGPTVNSSHVGQTLQVKVSNGSWYCWASIVVSGGSGGGGPVAICDVNTQVSLSSSGTARINWQTFDDGSYVNCGSVAYIKVRRDVPGWCPPGIADDTQFRDYVEFCCEDVQNSPVKVILRVYDHYGNFNDCWSNVYVEDKLHPSIYCPPDITVSCDYHIDYNHLSHFGQVHMNQSDVQPIYIQDPHYYPNGHAGYDGYIGGGGCGGNYWVYESYHSDFTCGTGIIYRTFTIENTNYSCTQKIYVRDPYPFNGSHIQWPKDVELPGCGANDLDPSATGKPTWYADDCSLIATSYRDEVFTIVPDACFKVLRHWSVLDWCQYKPNNPYNKGRWNYTQVIKLKNSNAPEFPHCDDVTFCVTDVIDCSGKAPLYGNAYDDCTPDSLLNWHWCVDINNDGIGQYQGEYDLQGYTRHASDYFPFGTHRILWRVEDLCGKYNTCSYLFTVEDCKKPSPVCLGAISTVVMPSSGMIELNARHFDASSFDNCTASEDLIFSYSTDIYHTTEVFNCNNIGTNQIEIWVTDEAGNQQYCTAFLVLDDNDDVCPDVPMPIISGTVTTVLGQSITGSEVAIETGRINIKNLVQIGNDGQFDFGSYADIVETDFPLTIEKTDDPLNGVSVLDLLLMQKHILNLKAISDPYVMVAADVNGDHAVDARDLLETKQVMLNRQGIFSQNTSWMYLKNDSNVDPRDADRNEFVITASTDAPIQLDFIGIKLGDLNNSAVLGYQSGDTRSSRTMKIADRFLMISEMLTLPVDFTGSSNISGYFADLQIDESFMDVINVFDSEMKALSFEMNEGRLKVLQVDALKTSPTSGAMHIQIEVKKAGWLSEAIAEDQSHGAIVDENEEEFKVMVVLEGSAQSIDEPLAVQIMPNPFKSTTDLIVKNENLATGTIQIMDQTGKQLLTRPILSNERNVRFTIEQSMLPASGLYWVKTQLGNQVSVDKLLLIQ